MGEAVISCPEDANTQLQKVKISSSGTLSNVGKPPTGSLRNRFSYYYTVRIIFSIIKYLYKTKKVCAILLKAQPNGKLSKQAHFISLRQRYIGATKYASLA